jgi:translation initiation factor 2B subunit (eIF-2B alpha/beta/delta family)
MGSTMSIVTLGDVCRWLAQHVEWATEEDRDKMRKAVDLIQGASEVLEKMALLVERL